MSELVILLGRYVRMSRHRREQIRWLATFWNRPVASVGDLDKRIHVWWPEELGGEGG